MALRRDLFDLLYTAELIVLDEMSQKYSRPAIPDWVLKRHENDILDKVEDVTDPFFHRGYMGRLRAIQLYRQQHGILETATVL